MCYLLECIHCIPTYYKVLLGACRTLLCDMGLLSSLEERGMNKVINGLMVSLQFPQNSRTLSVCLTERETARLTPARLEM